MLCSHSALGGFPLKLFWRECRFTVHHQLLSEVEPQPEESVNRLDVQRGLMRSHGSGGRRNIAGTHRAYQFSRMKRKHRQGRVLRAMTNGAFVVAQMSVADVISIHRRTVADLESRIADWCLQFLEA